VFLVVVESVHHVLSDCKTSVQHSNRAREKKLQHFLVLLQHSNIVLIVASFLVQALLVLVLGNLLSAEPC